MTCSTGTVAIFVVVERGKADMIVDSARKTGAAGATVFFARGTGSNEHLSLFRIQVEPMKEVVLLVVPEPDVAAIVAAITDAGQLNEPGKGILFTVPVGMLVGLEYRKNSETRG